MARHMILPGVTLALYFLRPLSHRISASLYWRPIAALGAISYSLYLIHQFNLTFASTVARKLLPVKTPQMLLVVTAVSVHVALAAIFWFFCERPFVRKRSQSFSENKAAEGQAGAAASG